MDIKKKAFLEAYKDALGNVTASSKATGINRCTYYEWLKSDEDFKAAIDAVEPKEVRVDIAESALDKLIAEGNPTAIIFFLKTLGKSRGYVERQEVTGADSQPLKIQIDFKNATIEQLRELSKDDTE